MLTFEMSKQYKGTGISNGLSRGMLVYQNGDLLMDEGMGIGAVAVQWDGMNYFASIQNINQSLDRIQVTLAVDKMLQRTIYGIPSKPLTLFIEKVCTNMYKQREQGQGLLFDISRWINFLLQIRANYVPLPSRGTFHLTYEMAKDEIRVTLSGNLEETADKIFVMNELSGRMFHNGIVNGMTTPPPFGWQRTTQESRLLCEERGLSFATKETGKPKNLSTRIFWGREADKDHCWAGYIYELQTRSTNFSGFSYVIKFEERD